MKKTDGIFEKIKLAVVCSGFGGLDTRGENMIAVVNFIY